MNLYSLLVTGLSCERYRVMFCCEDAKRTEMPQDVYARQDLERQREEVAVLIEELRAQV